MSREHGRNARLGIVTLAWVRKDHPGSVTKLVDALGLGSNGSDEVEIVVVANGRPEHVPNELRDDNRISTLVLPGENLGVAIGWNIGVTACTAPIVVVVNDDVVVSLAELHKLVAPLIEDASIGLVGVNPAAWDLRTLWPASSARAKNRGELLFEVPAGFLFAVRKQAWSEMRGLDARLSPAFFEEVDLALRMRATGYCATFVEDLQFEHPWGVSRSSRFRRIEWLAGSVPIGRTHRRNHRTLLRSRPAGRSSMPHAFHYWPQVARWRLTNLISATRSRARIRRVMGPVDGRR